MYYYLLFIILIRFYFISTIDKKILRNIFKCKYVFNLHKQYKIIFDKYTYLKPTIKIIALPCIIIYLS